MMDIKDIQKEKAKLEVEISKQLNQFYETTGCTVTKLDVSIIDTSTLSVTDRQVIFSVISHVELYL